MLLTTLAIVVIGGIGGLIAKQIGLPLPYMLGSLLTTSVITVTMPRAIPEGYKAPELFRAIFIGLIGLSIGSRVTLEVLLSLRHALPSFVALTLLVPLMQWSNFQVFRRVGGYDRPTAFFSGTPGGLVEAMLMGEQSGADARLVTMQQFLRIIFVVTLLPVGLSIYYGHPLGSAGGMSLAAKGGGLGHLPELALLMIIGVALGRVAALPAGQLVGPLLIGAIATLTGLVQIEMPGWMLSLAQIVIGSTLGARFHGMNGALILRGAGLAFLSVGSMLLIGCGFAALVHPLTGEPFDVLLISFSPGGVTEMALIALSLQANPAFVSVHHIYRILLTVLMMTLSFKHLRITKSPGSEPGD
ncbi:AbrB family transcriptional regulator [Pseudooceanicola sp.]|uniref:AbrB family transcriptional regulator n=1 Tax=Pseudooceanicola sp. TaxID=1914328 RepID=UPI00260BDBA6|nr:AbrB family transcriptional regulator [Pseudooceanicola sp.]